MDGRLDPIGRGDTKWRKHGEAGRARGVGVRIARRTVLPQVQAEQGGADQALTQRAG
jgi:hypothetical protein